MIFDDVPLRVLNALSSNLIEEIKAHERIFKTNPNSENFEALVGYLQSLSENFKADDRVTAMMLVNEILEPILFEKFLVSPELLADYLGRYLTCLSDLVRGLCDVNGDNLKYKNVKQDLVTPRINQLRSLIERSFEKSEAADLLKIIETF